MSILKHAAATNLVLRTLSPKENQRLLARHQQVNLTYGDVLCEPGEQLRHVYFPNSGIISLLTPVDGHTSVEVGLVGREGMAGMALFLGVNVSPVGMLVQGSGTAMRIRAAEFRHELGRNPALRRSLNRYLYGFMAQVAQTTGCTVDELFCEVDGNFPNHHPDPSQPKNLQDLIAHLKTSDAEIGLAFDGDGDRLGVVTKDGSIIFPDRQLMLFADDVLSRNPGAEIIFDVKSTRKLFDWIRERGGRPTLWKTGHSFIKAKMKETGALLAGEMSGHVFFKERWYGFDDGLYAGARLLEYLSRQPDINATLHGLPDSVNTPELNIKMAEGEHYALMERLQKTARFPTAKEVITLDGLRVEYADGFGLARPSNTTPVIVLRFEADNAAALEKIQADFRRVIHQAAPDLALPF